MNDQQVVHRLWMKVAVVLLFLPALFAYNPFPLYFLNDDFIHIPLSQVAQWGQRNSIRPFGDFSLYIDSLLWGKNPVGYHFTNLLFHIINTILIYFLSLRLLPKLNVVTQVKFWSAGVALLFWNYAFHSESVFWIIGRSASLSTIFFLVCLLIFLSGKRLWYHYFFSFISFCLALLTYESVLILPGVLLLLYLVYKEYRGIKNIVLVSGYWLLVGVYLVLRIKWTGEIAGAYEGGLIKNFEITALLSNFFKLVARSFVGPQTNSLIFVISVITFFALLMLAMLRFVKPKTLNVHWLFWIGIALFSLLPYVSLGIDTHGVESERYLYLPSVFICMLVVAFIASFKNLRIGFILFLCYLVYHQFYLFKEAKAFVVASAIAKQTIEEVEANKHKKFYYFENLPKENYGVPIFRLGLVEGIEWLANDSLAFQKVRVVSFDEDEQKIFNDKLELRHSALPDNDLVKEVWMPVKGAAHAFEKRRGNFFIRGTDLLMHYSDNTISVAK